jgi:ATP-dependent Clp protease protease subunit
VRNENEKNRPDLNEYGVLNLFGEISGEAAGALCRQIIQINVENKLSRIQLLINSGGGDCHAGFAILDIMDWSRIPIATTGIGMVGSMALLVFMAGERGNRVLTPRTALLSHRYSSIHGGNHSQILAFRKQEDTVHQQIVDHYLEHTRLETREQVEEILLRDVDTWLSPKEAVELGIADIIEPLGACSRGKGSAA